MRHQWWCGGIDPCACMDSWKKQEAEAQVASAISSQALAGVEIDPDRARHLYAKVQTEPLLDLLGRAGAA